MTIRSDSQLVAGDDTNTALALWRVEERTLEKDLRDKAKVEARIYHLYKNNDIMRAMIDKYVDSIVGKKVILQSIPDHVALRVTKREAAEWSENVERVFHLYADSPDNWISANQQQTFTGLCRTAALQEVVHGEILATREWNRTPLGFSTCFQMVTPDRLKNPSTGPSLNGLSNSTALTPNPLDRNGNRQIFEGIEFDNKHAPRAYWIEGTKRNDGAGYNVYDSKFTTGATSVKRYGKRTRFGWLQVFHIFEGIKPEYPRGISRLTSVIRKLKQIDRYSQSDLDKAIIAASYVFAITSDEDPETIADMLSGVDSYQDNNSAMAVGQDVALPRELKEKRQEIYDQLRDRYVKLKGGQIMHLFKGESIEAISPPVNQGSPSDFRKGHVGSVANTIGMSYEQATGDYSGVNFSGGQLANGNFEHTLGIRREFGVYKFATLMFRSWLNEAISKGVIPLLGGMPYFPNREAYAKATFTGTNRIYVDDVKRARSNQIDLANGTTSRISILAEKGGDFTQLAAERSREAQIMLQELDDIAQVNGVFMSDAERMSFVASILASDAVEIPANLGEDNPDTSTL